MLGPQILVVDDDPAICSLVSSTLEDVGYRVTSAGNADDALAMLRLHKEIEVLLSDIRMPHKDGYLLAMAALECNSELKIILMTGYAELPPAALLQAPEIRTIYKPLDFDRLCGLVEKMLSRQI